MIDDELRLALKQRGIDSSNHRSAWSEASDLLAAFDALVRAGGSVSGVEFNGVGDGPVGYYLWVFGGRLGKRSFRKHGADLRALLREALAFYLESIAAGD